jgi:hypothetical protein
MGSIFHIKKEGGINGQMAESARELLKDSYRNGRNTPPTLIQNLKPLEISKIILTSFEHL